MNIGSSNFSIKADTLFLIVTGQKNIMDQLVDIINNKNNNDEKRIYINKEKFILTKIDHPSAFRSIELMKEINNIDDINMLDSTCQKVVLIDDGIEFAQGHLYAEGDYSDNYYILQVLTDNSDHYILSFLKFTLDDDDNPESIIEDWFKKQLGKIPSSIKKSIKLITVAGSKSNILVISTELKKI
jgi:hypothetical protein